MLFSMLFLCLKLVDSPRHVDSSVNLYTIFKPRHLEFPWFDFLYFWFLARQIYKLQICWRDLGDPLAVFQILAAEATNVNLTFAKMTSGILETICSIKDDIFNVFLLKCLIIFKILCAWLGSCLNVFLEFISVQFCTVLLSFNVYNFNRVRVHNLFQNLL